MKKCLIALLAMTASAVIADDLISGQLKLFAQLFGSFPVGECPEGDASGAKSLGNGLGL